MRLRFRISAVFVKLDYLSLGIIIPGSTLAWSGEPWNGSAMHQSLFVGTDWALQSCKASNLGVWDRYNGYPEAELKLKIWIKPFLESLDGIRSVRPTDDWATQWSYPLHLVFSKRLTIIRCSATHSWCQRLEQKFRMAMFPNISSYLKLNRCVGLPNNCLLFHILRKVDRIFVRWFELPIFTESV